MTASVKLEQAKLVPSVGADERGASGLRRPKCTKPVIIFAAIFFTIVAIVLILMFTIFHIKRPIVQLSGVKIASLNILNNNSPERQLINLSLVVDFSVKNPNMGSFKFSNATTRLTYENVLVGEGVARGSEALPHKTVQMSIPLGVQVDRMVRVRQFSNDVLLSLISFNIDTRVQGEVQIKSITRRILTVNVRCSFFVSLREGVVQLLTCDQGRSYIRY